MSVVIRELELPLAEFTLDVTLDLTERTTALYGPSGAGKTTLLELIAGLRRPRKGRIELHGRVVCDEGVFVRPRERRVGYVPQDDALFPHLSVRQNVEYGCRFLGASVPRFLRASSSSGSSGSSGSSEFLGVPRSSSGAAGDRVTVIDVLELGPLLDRGVGSLSGGERKRVALARALLARPDVLLLDEPLAGVDLALRDRVLEYLLRVRDEFGVPTIYVTHHLNEAEAICDELVMLDRGRVVGRRTL